MIEILRNCNSENLANWFSENPIQWAPLIASRTALRVLPLVSGYPDSHLRLPPDLLLGCFHTNLLIWAAQKYLVFGLRANISAAGKLIDAHVNGAAKCSYYAAESHSAYEELNASAVVHNAVTAVSFAYAEVDGTADADIRSAIQRDAEWLLQHPNERLIDQPLWLGVVRQNKAYKVNVPPWARLALDHMVGTGPEDQHGFEPWIGWYSAFIPNSANAVVEDYFGVALTREIALQGDEWWDRPAAEVNADITAWMDRDASSNEFDRDLETALKNLPEQTPAAYRFLWRDNRIKAEPPNPSPGNNAIAQDLLDEIRRKALELSSRLMQSNADPYALRSVNGLLDILTDTVGDLRPGLLLSRARSVEVVAAAFAGPDEKRELFPGAVALALDLSETVRDLQGCLPEIREIEAERLALEIDPRNVDQIGRHLETIVETAIADEEVVDESAKEALRTMTNESVQDAPTQVRQRLIADRVLVVRNFLSPLFRGAIESRLATGVTGTTGEIWVRARAKFVDGAAEGLGSMGRPVAVVGVSALIVSLLGPTAGIVAMVAGFGRFDLLVKLLAKRLQNVRSDTAAEPEDADASLSD